MLAKITHLSSIQNPCYLHFIVLTGCGWQGSRECLVWKPISCWSRSISPCKEWWMNMNINVYIYILYKWSIPINHLGHWFSMQPPSPFWQTTAIQPRKTYSQVTRETSNHRRLKQGCQVSITLAQGRWDYKYTNCNYWHLQVEASVFSSVISSLSRTSDREFADKNNLLNLCHVTNV